MDISSQREQAYALIETLPSDYLEIVVALMRKLQGLAQKQEQKSGLSTVSEEKDEALAKVRAIAGSFSTCQSKDWKDEKATCLQERFHS